MIVQVPQRSIFNLAQINHQYMSQPQEDKYQCLQCIRDSRKYKQHCSLKLNEITPCPIVINTCHYTEAGVTGIRFMTVDRAHKCVVCVCARVWQCEGWTATFRRNGKTLLIKHRVSWAPGACTNINTETSFESEHVCFKLLFMSHYTKRKKTERNIIQFYLIKRISIQK